ncbi:hypothetical protein K3N28_22190 [Glycomyces sp. TRM65418]|uniref:YqeB family protein n=1 Tax=Glycomyces sp. TRM65418 TaxID=2867006 RepID=UPI001CE4D1C4|nr:hypothetical protein [Glycomyces sp. TRM65418]MCC3765774.1 hypothetical protein [Glycomyces sp. TRM65418]QZD55364.1 hypothetical protein K3N28_22070 [Glycomyces sp. TRM65418]
MPTDRAHDTDSVVVADAAWIGPTLCLLLPIVGAAIGWGLTFIVDWIVGLSWFPFQGLFELFTELSEPVRLIVAIGLGLLVGFLLALWAVHEMLKVTVGRDRLGLKRGDYEREIDRADVASVFVEEKRMVVLGHRRQEIASVEFDLSRERLAAALRRYGYTWLPDGDPYAGEFRRWVPGAEGLPKGANPVLKARQQALEKSNASDLRELAEELSELGVVVHDKDKKQYWRLADPA